MLKNIFIFSLLVLGVSLASAGNAYAAVGSFTANNVHYDTSSHVLTFDIGSPTESVSLPPNVIVLQSDNSHQLYDTSPTSCTSSTGCTATLSNNTGGGISGDSVVIRVMGDVNENISQSLSYTTITAVTTPTPEPVAVNTDAKDSISHLLNSMVHGLLSAVPVALPIVAVLVVSVSAIFFLWKLARHFLGV